MQKIIHSIQIAAHYLAFLLKARHRKGHGIHSPFVYNFVRNVLFDKAKYPYYKVFKKVRSELMKSNHTITMTDIGAASSAFTANTRRIRDMVKTSSARLRYGKLFFRIARYYKPKTIIELGTSLGYSTLFFAKGDHNSQVITLEGNSDLCSFATQLFRKNKVDNITIIEGLFDEQLNNIADKHPKPELVFIDGNHAYEPTIKYFKHFCEQMDEGIMLFDDIYWSGGMRRAWKEIENDTRAHVTINLFFLGIVIRQQSITPGTYTIRY